jgi:predicted pyridoxine 5'-phosphate oxidase superfamily flavin-nucleotide-binding protein
MVKLTPEMMEAFRAGRIFPLATASGDGEPNVAPMGAVYLRDAETIWIGNQFMKTTLQNVLENPRACLYVWGPGIKGCYKIKGDITVLFEGADYETMREEVKRSKPHLSCRSLLVMKVTGVYECMAGEHAGDRLV